MKTVIEMAQEAGIGDSHGHMIRHELPNLERLVELARADERDRAMRENAYVAYEREQCAQIAETAADCLQNSTFEGVAAAIRARDQA